MMSRYGIDYMRHAIFKRLRGDVLVESSWHGAHNWWFHSRIGAWDHATWAVKRFHDVHIDYVAKVRDKYLLEPQMGWWAPRQPVRTRAATISTRSSGPMAPRPPTIACTPIRWTWPTFPNSPLPQQPATKARAPR